MPAVSVRGTLVLGFRVALAASLVPGLATFSLAENSPELLRQKCDARDGTACYELALCYRAGSGVPRDSVEAERLAARACKFGTGQTCFSTCVAGFDVDLTCSHVGNNNPHHWDVVRSLLNEKDPARRRQIVIEQVGELWYEVKQEPPYAEFAALPDLKELRAAMDAREIELARTDPDPARRAAIAQCCVPFAVVEEMAVKDTDPGVRKKAHAIVAMFVSDADVAKQATSDPDPEVRGKMVQRLEDPSLLARIARKDSVARVRAAAVFRLGELGNPDQGLLERIAEKDADDLVRIAAASRLTDQKALVRLARSPSSGVRESVIKAVNDQSVLAWAAEHDADYDNRLEATQRVTNQQVLARIARTSEDSFAQSTAIGRITDIAILTDLAKSADPRTSRLASERLQTLQK